MRAISLSHLGNGELIGTTRNLAASDRTVTADLVWHLAEIDARRLHLEQGFPSMKEFCRKVLGMTEDVALKRIRVLRTVRRFPALLDRIVDGRLSLTAVIQLRPYLNRENVAALVASAERKTSFEIERMLAERFPRTEELALVEAVPAAAASVIAQPLAQLANGDEVAVRPLQVMREVVARPPVASRVEPVATRRFALHVMMSEETNAKLDQLKALLGHQIPSGDVGAIVDRAFDALLREAQKSKFAATDQPQKKERPTASARHIPSRVKRAVRARDGMQCTFVSPEGRRCGCMTQLEYDHIVPVAHGGKSTVDNVRMRCRGHNQYEAERTFGSGFMERKRAQARSGRTATVEPSRRTPPTLTPDQIARNTELARAAAAECKARAREQQRVDDVIPWLRALGVGIELARKAAETCRQMTEASLEERVKEALRHVGPALRPLGSGTT